MQRRAALLEAGQATAPVSFDFVEDSERRGGLTLEWRDLCCYVPETVDKKRWHKMLSPFGYEPQGPVTKKVLHEASGFARPGEVLALMGPSGCGKTTLLNVLGQRPTLGRRGKVEGTLLLNGMEPWSGWEREMAYVMQKDIFYEELGLRENLVTTALLRLPYSWTNVDKLKYLDDVMEGVGIKDIGGTRVGSATKRGLSGGELKRTNIANEMLARPRIFLLDEPLTGLDSTRAVEVMTSLRLMARNHGTTIMLSIHQPSSALYDCFDRLMLMAKGGRTVYFGDIGDAVPYFSKLGRPVPANWAASDHYIELVANEETREELVAAWKGKDPEGPNPAPRPLALSPMPPLTYQTRVLLTRQSRRIRRSYLKLIATILHSGLAMTWGLLYFRVGAGMPDRLTDFVGALFFVVAHWSWTPLFQGLTNFPKEKEMLTKDTASKVYDIAAFWWAQVIAEVPILLVYPIVFFVIFWPLTFGFAPMSVFTFVKSALLVFLNVQVCAAMSMLISAACLDDEKAIVCAIIVMVFDMSAGGYFADMRKLPPWIGWTRYLSSYFYTFGALMRLTILEPYGEALHDQAIEHYAFSTLGYAVEIAALAAMIVLYRALAFIQLRTTKRLRFS